MCRANQKTQQSLSKKRHSGSVLLSSRSEILRLKERSARLQSLSHWINELTSNGAYDKTFR
ncbi:hypothetical protein E4413_04660 [Leptospira interrogans]|nr:hypothetical protein E4414_03960 [Leptospira interrogans]QCO39098.1 hypothetical protein E4412_14020 [Leptospira interrogans]QCO42753.1 hypothetical protein E4413_04660 [Leptospira interrogans]